MNIQSMEVLMQLQETPGISQRELAEKQGYSLGNVNKCIQTLLQEGWINREGFVTEAGQNRMKMSMPRRAVILAAGFGMRMVPINREVPKGLLEVRGERLIDRLISQLHACGIFDISVVVGFMKESFEYLIDSFGVRLIVNEQYASRNNLYSLYLARDHLENAYIVPCDLYFEDNPFRVREMYSYYLVGNGMSREAGVRLNRRMELCETGMGENGNRMIGVCYLTGEDVREVTSRLVRMQADVRFEGSFWEQALVEKGRFFIPGRLFPQDRVMEINTYEQLRDADEGALHLKSAAMEAIAETLGVSTRDITGIEVLKKGMTNRSFIFRCAGKKYIMRIPGEGSEKMINRAQEAEVYRVIAGKGMCDDCVMMDPRTGYKITRYLEGVRTCNPDNEEDLRRCMDRLRSFHAMKLTVRHVFDPFREMERYESFWEGKPSVYGDHEKTKTDVLALRPFIEAHVDKWQLCHIDANQDNFLFYPGEDGTEQIQLTDWEYAGMQDPDIDIAMFVIYAMYDRRQADHLIDLYYEGRCPDVTRLKIYAYMAVCGLLWSDWCEYKRFLGVEFGEYALRQYRYAKDYARLVLKETGEKYA